MIAYKVTADQLLIRRYTILHIIPLPQQWNRPTKLNRALNRMRILQGRTYAADLTRNRAGIATPLHAT